MTISINAKALRASLPDVVKRVQKGARFTVIYRALELFFQHRDKGYSFTDCTSFAVMRELKLTSALTTDKRPRGRFERTAR